MTWGMIGSAAIGVVGSAVMAPDEGGGGNGSGLADPFAPQRAAYQTKLNSLMEGNYGPDDPSYKFRFDQGMEAVNRSAAAGGYMNSGRQLTALTDYGQGMASTEFSNQYQRLTQLAGANIGSPATAAQIQYGQNQQDQQALTAGVGSIAEAGGQAFGNWMNSDSGGDVDMTGFHNPNYSSGGSGFFAGAGSPAYSDPLPQSTASFGSGWMV